MRTPGHADAIFTDRLGESLEYQLEKLHPTPKPAEEAADSDSDSDSDKDDSSAADKADKPAAPKTFGDSGPPPASTFGHGKGTLFLVDAHSRVILWSIYAKPPNSAPGDLDRSAKRIVARLKQDLAGK